MSDSLTRSGAARITIGEGTDKIVIESKDQFNDASLKVSRDVFEHKTQSSSRPVKYVVTGLEGQLELSLSNVSPEKIALLFSVDLNETSETYSGSVYSRTKVEVKDNAGKVLSGTKVVIEPYPIVEPPLSYSPTSITGDATNGFSYDGQSYTTAGLARRAQQKQIDDYYSWLNSRVVFPNGALTDINGTNLAFGLSTQQELKLMITSLPDEKGARMVFGDETVGINPTGATR